MMRKCSHCRSSNVIKNGNLKRWAKSKRYRVQRYLCNDCGRSSFGKRIPL